ncbi:MAG TPA: hypothetical protein DCG57_09085 [Candidatus Riflebacteria bacterium]|jgi:tetratricopeptide (TPR) repeat protein|nr:hypothetical protein [Candidatus Riflebacteria bacterium]
MAHWRRLAAIALLTAGIFICPDSAVASRKATDLMGEALRQRAAGNIHEAISSFEYALENASTPLQRNLARFMLGDCQIEAGRHKDAVRTFDELLESVDSPEEQAEAIYRLMQAESALGNRNRVESLFARMRRSHRSSPYFELGQAFVKSEGLRIEADEIPEKVQVAARPRVDSSKATSAQEVRTPPAAKPAPQNENQPAAPQPSAAAEQLPQPAVADTAVASSERQAPIARPAQTSKTEKRVEAVAARPAPGSVKLGDETSRLLRSVLSVAAVADDDKDQLATRILSLQDSLKDGMDRPGMDKVLLELAEATASFGELLEACKTYDQLLTNHPASPLVERAYYEAIRLRAVLGVHEAVIGWSKAFLAAFPTSEFRGRVRALVEYAQAGGRVDLGQSSVSASASASAKPAKTASSKSGNEGANAALNADSEYAAASNKMKEGRYNLALIDFKRLSGKHPQSPQIWWDLSLVNVQLEDFSSAEKAIKKMIALDPNNQDANSLLGYIHYRLENYEEAATAYEQAGEPEGRGVNFFDAKTASQRMKKTAGKRQAD